ncbi:pyridoxamine 5'-phosphate oxidase family protein [Candidatus Poriferisocius sp.]|uniref:pyridoxamine 5'-phosphate oxidase family protein n=1 Tax=Candidatus Poriferisocius sp. TaxID=3101276 RepID=UPI003B5B5D60
MTLPDSAKRVIDKARPAHVVTLYPSGAPQLSLVWVGRDDDQVLYSSGSWLPKVKNLRSNPSVIISIEDDETNHAGLTQHLLLRGTAQVVDDQSLAADFMDVMSQKYLGVPDLPLTDLRAPDSPPQALVRVTVDQVGGVGPWVEGMTTSYGTGGVAPEDGA